MDKKQDETAGWILRAQVCWALALAVPNQVAIWQRAEPDQVLPWVSHHVFDIGQMLALGLICGSVGAWLSKRFRLRRSHALLVIACASLLVGAAELPSSFEGFADSVSESLPLELVLWSMVVVTSLSVPLAAWVGTLCARGWAAVPCLVVALAVALANNFVLDQDYFGLHLFITLNAFALGSGALFALRPGQLRWLREPGLEKAALGVLVAFAAVSFFLPSNRLMLRLSGLEGAPLARASAGLRSWFARGEDAGGVVARLPEERRAWWQKRQEATPPGPRLLPDRPIVILLTIDCMRADVFDGKKRSELPYFDKLTKQSVYFSNARAAGSATVPSLSAMFSGKYYSELVWKRRSKGADVWPMADDSVRFPEILQRAGVDTVTFAAKTWLLSERGVVRGFSEKEDLDQNRKPRSNHVKFREVRPKLQQRLSQGSDAPLFFYAHLMDPHSPYNSGKRKKGKVFSRYVSEIDAVGRELQKLDDWLEREGLRERTTLVITADHGEAFGEHATWQHSKTLYEELVHVPLWIRVPGTKPRRVDDLVSLIDLGPTLLDLFGQPTPPSFQGQSLVPFLAGGTPELTRPVAAETRLIQMMVFPNGKKAIFDIRRGTYELYDLLEDPREKQNLAEDGSSDELRLLRAFFRQHQNPIYKRHAPYRP